MTVFKNIHIFKYINTYMKVYINIHNTCIFVYINIKGMTIITNPEGVGRKVLQ